MKYADARAGIQSGDAIAYTHRGVRSWYDLKLWLVRLFGQTEYTHIAIAWCVAGRVFLLESVGAGVRIFPMSLDLPAFHLTGKGLTDEQLEFALAQAGKPYSYLDCVEGYLGTEQGETSHWMCAKYVAKVLALPCKQTPSDVVAYLLAQGSMMQEIQQ